MGQWDDKFVRAEKKWASWTMHDYSQTERVLSHIIGIKRAKILIMWCSSSATNRSRSGNLINA